MSITIKQAINEVGGVQLELCQPVEGDSIYRDFLNEHEEGFHQIFLSPTRQL